MFFFAQSAPEVILNKIDTVEVIDVKSVVDFYETLLESQSNQYSNLIIAILTIMGAILGITFWWNIRGAKQQIKQESDKNKQSFQRFFKSSTTSMEKSLEESIEKKMDAYSKTIHNELEDYKNATTKTINAHNAELNRVFALHCDSTKSYFTASTWWCAAARLYNETGNEQFTQISINAAQKSLSQAENDISQYDDVLEKLDDIISDVDSLPDYVAAQKAEIKKLVKKYRGMVNV